MIQRTAGADGVCWRFVLAKSARKMLASRRFFAFLDTISKNFGLAISGYGSFDGGCAHERNSGAGCLTDPVAAHSTPRTNVVEKPGSSIARAS